LSDSRWEEAKTHGSMVRIYQLGAQKEVGRMKLQDRPIHDEILESLRQLTKLQYQAEKGSYPSARIDGGDSIEDTPESE